MAASPEPEPAIEEILTRKRPSPRVAQFKRTLFFLRRNTLAVVGLAIILFFIGLAIYSVFDPMSGDSLTFYCGTNGPPAAASSSGCVQVCTYPAGTTSPQAGCLETFAGQNSVIPPTITLNPLSGGPLPFGSLTLVPGGQNFYSVYQGILKGAGWDVGISGAVVVSGAMIGLLLGAVSGFRGGYTDETIMRTTDVFLSIPQLLLVIVVALVLGQLVSDFTIRVLFVIAAFVVTWWPTYARIVRGQVLVVREQKYVEAAKASGAKNGRIIRKHIIPNSVFPIFVQMSLDFGTIPLIIAGIVFLGFRIFPSYTFPEWGTMAALPSTPATFNSIITTCANIGPGVTCLFPWWTFFFPGLVIFLFAISVNFFSDGLRDALDPRLRR